MIRLLIVAAASLLMTGVLFAEDEKKVPVQSKPESPVTKKETPETKSETTKQEPRKRGDTARPRGTRAEGIGHRGRVTKATIENGVIKITLEGKEYEFAIGENTRAMLRTVEKDGKEVVVGLNLSNAAARQRGERTRPARKPKTE